MPTASVAAWHAADPAATGTAPQPGTGVPPSAKATVPLGRPPGKLTFALSMALWPNTVALGLAASVVAVVAGWMVSVVVALVSA